jgi:hypothetical protein
MNSPCSLAPEAASLERISLDGDLSATSSGTPTASRSSPPESETAFCPSLPSSLTCVSSFSPVQPNSIEELRTYLAQAFPARRSPSRESSLPATIPEICGPLLGTAFAWFDLDTSSWKTSQGSLLADTSESSSPTWPRWATWDATACWELPIVEPATSASGYGFVPTPTASDYKSECMSPNLVEVRAQHSRGVRLTEWLHRLLNGRRMPTPNAGNDHWGGGVSTNGAEVPTRSAARKLGVYA